MNLYDWNEMRLVMPSPVGKLLIVQGEGGITRLTLAGDAADGIHTPLLKAARAQLAERIGRAQTLEDSPADRTVRPDAYIRADRGANRKAPSGARSRHGESQESDRDHHTVSSHCRGKRSTDRLCAGAGNEAGSFAYRRDPALKT